MQERHFGVRPSPVDVRDFRQAKIRDNTALPSEFTVNLGCLSDAKDQWVISSCVAFSLALIVEYNYQFQMQQHRDFSTGFIYGNRKDGDYEYGLCLREALLRLVQDGDCFFENFPENIEVPGAVNVFKERYELLKKLAYPHRISGFFKCATNAEIKTALMQNGPVIFSVAWYSDFDVNNGVLNSIDRNERNCDGYHAMVIYGWDERGWKIQNSWGKDWGEEGRAILPFDIPIRECYGIVDTIIDGEESSDQELIHPFSGFIGKIFAKIVNFGYYIVNIFSKWILNLKKGG